MTEQEVCEWAGLGWPLKDGQHLRPEIAAGMAAVPVPADGDGRAHVAAFQAFLACAGRPPARDDPRGDPRCG